MPGTVTVKIENDYIDGYSFTKEVTVDGPPTKMLVPDADLDEWWEDKVWPETGSGRDSDVEACYTATITAVEGTALDLVGECKEWV